MHSQRLDEGALLSGRYEILEVVGRGGMGTVYRARDNRLEIIVAVKEMTDRDVPPEERDQAVRQFEREAKLLGQLSHPNLPRVTDYFVEDDHCYLIMEFVVGETLEKRLHAAEGQPLPLLDVLNWGISLADVLAYLHSQDPPIVFRDVKPANIMVQADEVIKLIDFGIARRFHEGATKDTLLYGSPGYSPPEQYGRSQTDPRSDLYALGATLHHLVTGRDPAPTPFKFPAVRSLDPSLPIQLDVLIGRCVEMDVDRRPTSAEDVRDTLIHIRGAVLSAPPPAPPPTQRPSSSRPQPTGPKVVSSRVRAADDARLLRRMALAGLILLAVGGAAALAIRMAPRGDSSTPKNPPGGVNAVLPPKTDSVISQPPAGSNPPQTGTLTVNTSPAGVKIILDGREMGSTPQEIKNIAPGRHTLRLVPRPESGFVAATRYVEVLAGQHKEIDTQLTLAPTTPPAPSANPAGEVRLTDVHEVTLPDPPQTVMRLTLSFRVTGASGKPGQVAVVFYGADQVTPIKPKEMAERFADAAGRLVVWDKFDAANDLVDFPAYTLDLPLQVLPLPAGQVYCQAVLYVDAAEVGKSPIYPLKSSASSESR
jgi:serine/threonine protein kinase